MSTPPPRPLAVAPATTAPAPHPVASIRVMAEVLAELARPTRPLLAAAGLEVADLDRPHLEVTWDQELAAIEHLVAVAGDVPGLGLRTGQRYRIVTYGAFGLGLLTARDLRRALELGITYQRLTYSLMSFALRPVGGDEVEVVMDDARLPAHLRTFLVERDLAAVVALFDDAWGRRFPFRAITTSLPAPAHLDRYAASFPVPVRFGAAEHTLRFPAELLDHPLPQGTPAMEALYERQCRQLLTRAAPGTPGRPASAPGAVEEVLQLLLRAGGPLPSLEEAAASLAVSPRTLRRRLAAGGTSYRRLVSEVREQLARELLRDTTLSIERVAAELGYAETSSFSRAFHRWTGRWPSELRR